MWHHIPYDTNHYTQCHMWKKVQISLFRPWWHTGGVDVTPLILNLGTRWRWAFNFISLLLYFQGSPQYPLNRRLVSPRASLGCFAEETNIQPSVLLILQSSVLFLTYISIKISLVTFVSCTIAKTTFGKYIHFRLD